MVRENLSALVLLLALALPDPVLADTTVTGPGTSPESAPGVAADAAAAALPPMWFVSSLAQDAVLAKLKANPSLAGLDTGLAGSPLSLVVTHTYEPTSGGQASGLATGLLAASTLGIIPIVSNNRLVVRYEVFLNGKVIASHSFDRTATRAQNLWVTGSGQEGQLGKAGLEWAMSTVDEAALRLASDPALRALREDMEFYFPAAQTAGQAP